MTAQPSHSLLGSIFGSIWVCVVAPLLVSVLTAIIIYKMGLGSGQGDVGKPAEARPVRGDEPGRESPRRPDPQDEPKGVVSPDLDSFVK